MSKKVKELAPLKFDQKPAQKMVWEYKHSVATNTEIRRFPEWDCARADPEAVLVTKNRELYEAENRLADKRLDAKKRRKELDGLWADLEEKEKGFRDTFLKFNKFVKENQEKRERAERKFAEEKAITEKREADIAETMKNNDYMLNIRRDMEVNIKNHKMYEEYLQRVAKQYPVFRTVDDIIDRYETLIEAKQILAEKQQREMNSLETARIEMLRITEEKNLAIMGLNNVLAELYSRYETAKSKALQWDLVVTKIKDTLVERLGELYDVRKASWNIYLQMCGRKEIEPELDRDDVENLLLFIKRTMMELKRITRIVRRRMARESLMTSQTARSSKPPNPS